MSSAVADQNAAGKNTDKQTCLRFRGDARELADSVALAASVSPTKSPRAVLQNLLLQGREGILEVTGTDLEVAIRVRIEQVEIMQDGLLLVNAARFLQILRELSGEQVEVSTDERAGCTIATGDARFQVLGEDASDFPELQEWPSEGTFTLPAPKLVDMIRRTAFATHAEKTRYAMNGILLDLKDERVHLVATDGKRLALCERPLDFTVEKPVHVVVPTKGMTLLQRVLGPSEEDIELSIEDNQVHIKTSSALLSCRLVQGHFPPYEEVIPKDHDKPLTLPREAFLGALRRAALLATKDSQAVRFHFGREGLELTARVPEVGESRVQFPLDFPYDDLEIGFNPSYFADVLKVLHTTEFLLELKDQRSAAVVKEESEGQRYIYLVMPLSLGG